MVVYHGNVTLQIRNLFATKKSSLYAFENVVFSLLTIHLFVAFWSRKFKKELFVIIFRIFQVHEKHSQVDDRLFSWSLVSRFVLCKTS